MLATVGIGALATICMVGVAYSMVQVPKVKADSTEQGAAVFWNDGSPMMKIGSSRTLVDFNQISPNMVNAALAAEDHNFYHESAISPKGITRALINDLKGGATQGGSTITQQYVKNAYLSQDQTLSRKFKELFISVKVGKQQDKNTILQNYLNTIDFGRRASGVEAAAEAYFGDKCRPTCAKNLTVPQAAILAGTIKLPGYYDPGIKSHTPATLRRYHEVLQAMVSMGKLSPADFAKYDGHLPKVVAPKKGDALAGQKGFMYNRVQRALRGMGYTDSQITNGGLKVYTSWDKNLQEKAQRTVESDLKAHGMPKDTRVGLVTMNPTNGEILAAYGGADYIKREVDDAYDATAQIGSSFKPYVLAAALKKDISLKTTFNGKAPQWFNTDGDSVGPGDPHGVRVVNDEANPPNPYVNLVDATAESLNTVYVPLGFKTGYKDVYKVAKDAGLPQVGLDHGNPGESGFFLGQSDVAPLYQASGYSTIANDGTYYTPHSIKRVVDPTGKGRSKPQIETRHVFDPAVAHDVQYAMQAVVTRGTGVRAQIPGRQVAGKTGTTNENKAAWFSGFTPKQLVTTVGMWRFRDRTKKHAASAPLLQHLRDYTRINGGDLPAQIWHDYMTGALSLDKYKEATQFPPPSYVGNTDLSQKAPPKPTPTPTSTPMPTCLPQQDPAVDHCQPDPNNPPGHCRPRNPNCQTPPPDQTPTCNPVPPLGGCNTPTRNPGSGGKGGGTDGQAQSARPLKD